MSLLAQVGHGAGEKVNEGLEQEIIKGFVLSPRDRKPEKLEAFAHGLRSNHHDAVSLFDPQFYAASLSNPRDGNLSEYGYYKNNSSLGRAQFSSKRVQAIIKECLEYQHFSLGKSLSYLVSPSTTFDGFRDSWSQIALSLAIESTEFHTFLEEPQPLLISLIISESAFQSIDSLEEFLDELTEIDVAGFYIVVRRNVSSTPNSMEPTPFANLMYFCHVLSEINEYEVVVGYCDWQSFLLAAAGVSHTASGWYQNLRHFSLDRFQPSTGGRRPRKRYSSAPLLSTPLITPDLQDAYQANLLPKLLSGSQYDHILGGGPSAGESEWKDDISCLAHWYSLDQLITSVSAATDTRSRVDAAERLVSNAYSFYYELEQHEVYFEPSTGPSHINDWQKSIEEFRDLISI